MPTYSNAAIELGVRPLPQKTLGYAQWATWIASDIDSETFVFRKFDKLAALNLLYLQSEMLEIESDLRKLDEEILQRPNIDVATIDALRRFESLLEQSDEGSIRDLRRDEAQTRMKLVKRLRTKIREYHKALVLQRQVTELQHPTTRVVRALLAIFWHQNGPVIDGKAVGYLDDKDDLVALKSANKDPLSNYFRRVVGREATEGDESRIARFEESRITNLVNAVTTIVAAIFLVGPVLALYFVSNSPAKLALIAVFTAGFAASVTIVTNARRAEIFGATATYAAVLVVFVSNGHLSND